MRETEREKSGFERANAMIEQFILSIVSPNIVDSVKDIFSQRVLKLKLWIEICVVFMDE